MVLYLKEKVRAKRYTQANLVLCNYNKYYKINLFPVNYINVDIYINFPVFCES